MGVIYKNGIAYGGGTSSREITWAEYDALTDEEKNNGTEYYVKDLDEDSLTIVDNLTSDSSDSALSAKQGKVLKTLIDNNTSRIRNITVGTADVSEVTGSDGDMYFQYEA